MSTAESKKPNHAARTIGDILSENYSRARVFEDYDIDFCCGGDRPLKEVCDRNDIDLDQLVKELQAVDENGSSDESFEDWESEDLIDLIQDKHHDYTENAIARISRYLNKVRQVHGENHPEVLELADLWVEMGPEMLQHMKREDDVLFPYARRLIRADEPKSVETPEIGSARKLIESMDEEHDEVGGRLFEIKELTDEFTPPEDACGTFRALYSDLEDFVDVTMEHVFLENSVLFPRLVDRETA